MRNIPSFRPFGFQLQSINDLIDVVELNNGAFIFDETGLGKTITSLTTAINISNNILVISPKSNQNSWNFISKVAMNSYNDLKITITTAQSLHKLESDVFDLVIVDEVHNFRNIKSKTHRNVFEIIHKNLAKSLLLTATPFNNNFEEIKAICSLICFKNDSIGFHTLGNCIDQILVSEKSISIYDRFDLRWASFQHIGDVVSLEHIMKNQVNTLISILSNLSIRNSRKDIKKNYSSDVSEMGSFPVINVNDKYEVKYEKSFYEAIIKTIELIDSMPLARQNIINYVIFKPNSNKIENGDFTGIYKSLLFKRLESSVASFKKTVQRGLEGIYTIKDTIKDSKIKFGGVDYNFYDYDKFIKDLDSDIIGFKELISIWDSVTDDSKISLLSDILLNVKGKTIIFTEYKDSFDEIKRLLGLNVLYYDSTTSDNILEQVRTEFDNNVSLSERTDKFDILVCTDVLSEGVNMHRADNIIHFDSKWNPSKITQRNGRVDRITINESVAKQINVFTFMVDNTIESIIELQNKIDTKNYWGDTFKNITYINSENRFNRFKNGSLLSVHGEKTINITKVIRNSKYDFIYTDSSYIVGYGSEFKLFKNLTFENTSLHGYINKVIVKFNPSSGRRIFVHILLREGKFLKDNISGYLGNPLYSSIYDNIIKDALTKDKNKFDNILEYMSKINEKLNDFYRKESFMNIGYSKEGIFYTDQKLEPITEPLT